MRSHATQLQLPLLEANSGKPIEIINSRGKQVNKLTPEDRPIHDWYRFVLSFPPHLVRDYINFFQLNEKHTILDPFCGTGTTLVESKLNGIRYVGVEANPFAHFVSSVKIKWEIDPDVMKKHIDKIANSALKLLKSLGINDNLPYVEDIKKLDLKTLNPEATKLLLRNSISPVPLHKTLILLDCIKSNFEREYYEHELLALAKALVFSISNIKFGPEVGIGKIKVDTPVVLTWLSEIRKITSDLHRVSRKDNPVCEVHLGDARMIDQLIEPTSIDVVITSPPYPNEKDYSRTTRLESVILGFINTRKDLRESKRKLVRSNTRCVYKGDEDELWIAGNTEIQRIADEIERRRLELGKTSGFEKQYSKVTRLYFGRMARHLANLRKVLRPGARLAYVVGDQASYFRVKIKTGKLLGEIAQSLGYDFIRTDLFRERFATATGDKLREEVVLFRWPG